MPPFNVLNLVKEQKRLAWHNLLARHGCELRDNPFHIEVASLEQGHE